MATSSNQVPALILGQTFTALGVLQILGRQRIPVFVLTKPDDAIRSSKWFAECTVDGGCCCGPGDLPSFLEALSLQRAVLFPCSDEYAISAADLPGPLRERFPSSLPDADTICTLIDKLGLADRMRSLHLPHPETVPIDDVETLRRLAARPGRRGFLKPRNSQAFFRDFCAKAFWYESVEEAAALFSRAAAKGHEIIWQEYIGGPASRYFYVEGFIDRTGASKAMFARRRLRMYPPRFGNSSAMRSIPLEEVPGAVDTITRLLESTRYRGVFSAEFKEDGNGVARLLEINCRPWWYVNVAARCGVDVVRMAYEDALEREVAPVASYRTGMEFVYHSYDYHASMKEGVPFARMLRRWAGAKPAFYVSDDPNPSLKTALSWAKEKLFCILERE